MSSGSTRPDAAEPAEASDDTVQVGASTPSVAPASPDPLPGTAFDRYVVLEKVGTGGMGAVYRAYDPKLRREVALKLLRLARNDADRDKARVRHVREAQAMARMSHPNVLPVYDADAAGDQLFITMEFVDGQTLEEWSEAEERPWRDVVAMYIQAARGLAAAHADGLVHRDFKPANVMVGQDRRVRVMDFGLARIAAGAPSAPEREPSQADRSVEATTGDDALATPLTQTGFVMGTPIYMAIEQHAGEPADARSDQFSFCAALFEGLYGKRPFRGRTMRELARAKKAQDLPEDIDRSRVPARIHAAVLRGLSPAPEDRWPSMETLADELERDPGAQRRPVVLGVALVGLGGLAAAAMLSHSEPPACPPEPEPMRGAWTADTVDAVDSAMRATDVGFAPTAATHVRTSMDAYVGRWVAERQSACEATRVRREQSEEGFDLRMACLDDQRRRFEAVVDVLRQADASAVLESSKLVASLADPEDCRDLARLRRGVPLPSTSERSAVDDIEVLIARSSAEMTAGHAEAALDLAREAEESGRALDYAPVQAKATLQLGLALAQDGKFDDALERELEAYWAALRSRDDGTATDAADSLAFLLAVRLGRNEEALQWGRTAQALADRLDLGPRRRASLHQTLGAVAARTGDLNRAQTQIEAAVDLLEGLWGPDDPRLAPALTNLASVHLHRGDFDRAELLGQRTMTLVRDAYGPEHPTVSGVLNNLASGQLMRGQYDEALARFEEALTLRKRTFGASHPEVATTLNNLAGVYSRLGRHAEAQTRLERALEIREQRLGSEHPLVAQSLGNLAIVLTDLERYDDAVRTHRRALAIRESTLGPDHAEVATSLEGLANVLSDRLERHAEALPLAERATEIREAELGPEHPLLAESLSTRGRIHFHLGQLEEAVPSLERALALQTTGKAEPGERAETELTLSRALTERDPERAGLLAKQSVEHFEEAGPGWADQLEAARRVAETP